MSEQMPPAITPEAAFDMYRHLVEDNAQAVPILMAISEKGINAHVLEIDDDGIQPVLARLAMKMFKDDDLPIVAMLTSEAWVRSYEDGVDPRKHPEAPERPVEEGVIIAYADRAGNNWTAVRQFVRTNQGVRWKKDPIETLDAQTGGPVTDLLNAMVGRIDKVIEDITERNEP